MSHNVGTIDRLVRGIVGAVLLLGWVLGWFGGTWAVILGIVGIILVATALVGFCPLYRLFGMSTRPTAGKSHT
ncbi:MAG: DUF2892 domain-containing protein [Trueperaceae bacterium]